MIIEGLVTLVFNLLMSLLSFIELPDLSVELKNQVYSYIDTIIDYSAPLIDLFLPYDVAKVLLAIVISIEVILMAYKFIMWIITKIPMLNIQRQ